MTKAEEDALVDSMIEAFVPSGLLRVGMRAALRVCREAVLAEALEAVRNEFCGDAEDEETETEQVRARGYIHGLRNCEKAIERLATEADR